MPTPMSKDLVKGDQVALYLQVPLSTVYKLARERKLPGHKVGKHWRFFIGEVERWIIDGQPTLPPHRQRKAKVDAGIVTERR